MQLERGPLFVSPAMWVVSSAESWELVRARPGQVVRVYDDLPREIQPAREWHEPIEDEL